MTLEADHIPAPRTPGRSTREIEKAVGVWTRSHMPGWLSEFVVFVLKLGWASLFGGLMLIGLVVTKIFWTEATPIPRYDAMLIYAVAVQALFLYFRLETWDEARVIVLFHLSGTVMEIFKVYVGSWSYPDPGVIRLYDVPLFTGFMYAAVGSFMARAIRLFDMRFEPYPPFWVTLLLATAIYVNFFSHHFLADIRIVLFAATFLVFGRTWVKFHIGDNDYWMPMVLAGGLISVLLWIAENIGTSTETWLYRGQNAFDMVSLAKMGSWYLLIYVSFATVTLVFRQALIPRRDARATRPPRARPKEALQPAAD
ncbi:Uncharacterized protein YoaT [Candidatus Rhodobacter oscarellae]|uniref:Uncharacterized protein YoaT n=1 Tax=Candidatus Rhodobacter oscarellae TaxID=1675527 RepID=A0A0J9EDE6_9RHOB|nr:DUF817 domain-containing protein [Candidatus Rhodobacter lobularis]KMW60691.1 Uncharacterized protein YoaT [Candidatus Rhodobacter lobularis]